MLPSALHFLFMLLLVGLGLRWVETMFPDTTVAKALSYIY